MTPAQHRAMLWVESVTGSGQQRPAAPRRDVLARLYAQGLITIVVTQNPHARKVDRVQWFTKLTDAGREYLRTAPPPV